MITKILIAVRGAFQRKKDEGPQLSDEAIKAMASKLVAAMNPEEERIVKSFKHHFTIASKGEAPRDVEHLKDIIALGLKSLAIEINTVVPLKKPIEVTVKSESLGTELYVSGMMVVEFDTATPEVYDISMELLKEGFVYKTEESAFVITKKVAK